uniref:DUF4220 domain-containing protein n=1 Tax=Oryza punctata TaxID=4537 RepID=A0A0E0MP73_ORYPU
MVIMFLSWSFKYAERTLCLYLASPARLRLEALDELSRNLRVLHNSVNYETKFLTPDPMGSVFDWNLDVAGILEKKFFSNRSRCRAYDHVGEAMEDAYQQLYTKCPFRQVSYFLFISFFQCESYSFECFMETFFKFVFGLFPMFQLLSAPIALALFTAADKRSQLLHSHTSSSREDRSADVTVSYILLVGATILDVSSAAMLVFSTKRSNLPTGILRASNYILPTRIRKRWSEELAQYSMIKRQYATMQAETPLSQSLGDKAIRMFILDNLLRHGTRAEWNCASSRGQLALGRYEDPGSTVDKSTSSGVDFPTSVLIWHIATDICYYYYSSDDGDDQVKTKEQKEMSRQLSNYIMYLVFNCGVMLTNKSQIVHDKARHEITEYILSSSAGDHQQAAGNRPDEKDAVVKLFEACNNINDQEKQQAAVVLDVNDQQAGSSPTPKLEFLRRAEAALYYPAVPHACKVAKVLIGINGEPQRWGLIADVWEEMLYYIAPRCGAAFHYEHLSTGGEFVTHILYLMRLLGPFMPIPDGASAP